MILGSEWGGDFGEFCAYTTDSQNSLVNIKNTQNELYL